MRKTYYTHTGIARSPFFPISVKRAKRSVEDSLVISENTATDAVFHMPAHQIP